jgi:hypothetical protein
MKYAIIAAAFAVTASSGLSAQAAPSPSDALKFEATTSGSVQKVWYDRNGYWHDGYGWRRCWHWGRWHDFDRDDFRWRRWHHRERY